MQLSQPDGTPPETSDIVLPGGGYREISVTSTMSYPPKYDRYGNPTYPQSTVQIFNVTITPSGYMTLSLIIADNVTSVNLQVKHNSVITSIDKSVNSFISHNNHSNQSFINSIT